MANTNLRTRLSGALRGGFALCVTVVTLVNLTGCVAMSARELEPFTAKPVHERTMNKIRITWEVRDDVSEFCAKGMRIGSEKALVSPPMACAFWNVRSQECVIVTGRETSHTVLGHEVRHCFEGHFHN